MDCISKTGHNRSTVDENYSSTQRSVFAAEHDVWCLGERKHLSAVKLLCLEGNIYPAATTLKPPA